MVWGNHHQGEVHQDGTVGAAPRAADSRESRGIVLVIVGQF